MTTLRPGSLLWLLRFSVRLTWQTLVGRNRNRRLVVFVVLGVLALLGLGSLLLSVRAQLPGLTTLRGPYLLAAGALSVLALGLMTSAGVASALEALFERGDLDLLLHAPISPAVVFASRALGVALSAAVSVAVVAVPLGLLGPPLLGWHLLGVWPWWLSGALFAASVSLWLTLGLVRWLGVRRARTAASVIGALVGAAFFLTFQLRNLLGPEETQAVNERVLEAVQGAQGLPWLPALLYPARSLWLEPLPTALTLAASVGVFALTVLGLQRAFVAGAQAVRGVEGRRAAGVRGHVRFRGGAPALLFKEWRLLWRDPLLLSRVLLQVLYLIPLVVVVGRNTQGQGHLLYGSGGVLLAGSLAGALANLTLNAEDAPDLLRLAPLGLDRLRWAKLFAAVLPVWVLMALVEVWLATHGVTAWPWYALCTLVATSGTALIYLWRPMLVRRADVFRGGRSGGDLLSGVGRLGLVACLAVAAAGLPRGAWWGALGLLGGLLVVFVFWRLRKEV